MEKARYFRRKLLPTLLPYLESVEPTREEIVELFRRFALYHFPVAEVTKARRLLSDIEKNRAAQWESAWRVSP